MGHRGKTRPAMMEPAGDDGWTVSLEHAQSYSSAPILGLRGQNYGPGEPVLQWTDTDIFKNEELLLYLVWANPENVRYLPCRTHVSDVRERVFDAATSSPFYDKHTHTAPHTPRIAVLQHFRCFAGRRDLVMKAVARSGSELQFADAEIRGDPSIVAWAGAPLGAWECKTLPTDLVLFMKAAAPSALSVAYVEAHALKVCDALESSGIGLRKSVLGGGHANSAAFQMWPTLSAEDREALCCGVWKAFTEKYQFFFRVAPAVRDLLWPTPQHTYHRPV